MKIVGIDPGKSNGGIAIYDTKTGAWFLSKQPDELDWQMVFESWDRDEFLIGIEKQAIRQEDRDKPSFFGIQKLVNQTERMTATLRTLRLATVEIYPVSWQSPFRANVKADKRDKKYVFQDLATKLVKKKVALWGSDAVLIAYYLAKKLKEDPNWVKSRIPHSIETTIFESHVKSNNR